MLLQPNPQSKENSCKITESQLSPKIRKDNLQYIYLQKQKKRQKIEGAEHCIHIISVKKRMCIKLERAKKKYPYS